VPVVKGDSELRAAPNDEAFEPFTRVHERADPVITHAAAPGEVEDAERVGAVKKECSDDLAVAMPVLKAALAALDTITSSDVATVKDSVSGLTKTQETQLAILTRLDAVAANPMVRRVAYALGTAILLYLASKGWVTR
jgi:hypothetical protein